MKQTAELKKAKGLDRGDSLTDNQHFMCVGIPPETAAPASHLNTSHLTLPSAYDFIAAA